MLQALIAYAEREALGEDSFLDNIELHWTIPLTSQGLLAGPPIGHADPSNKKSRSKRYQRPFTSANELNQGDRAHFLCDTLERSVVFFDGKTTEKEAGRRIQHLYFKRLLETAIQANSLTDTFLRPVLLFLENAVELKKLHDYLREAKAKPSDNATFFVDGTLLLGNEFLELVRNFWSSTKNKSFSEDDSNLHICIATGKLTKTLDTTEKIRGVPGGLAVGTNLISFDKEAFSSFGLQQAQNAALSAPAELKIRAALNQLVQQSREQGLVFNEAVYLHWTRKPIDFDPFDIIAHADENAVTQLLRSVHQGKTSLPLDENQYYAASLSGNGARIVVRDWIEQTVPELEIHLAQWFEDLTIIDLDGTRFRCDFKMSYLLYSMVRDKHEELSPTIPSQLLRCAITGRSTPIPYAVLFAAINRQSLDHENKLNPARIGLLKACLVRTHKKENQMSTHLNPSTSDSAYQCGRLLAVFDRLQYLALGEVGAGVVERFYASASSTPALVMGRLFRSAQFHLAKTGGGVSTNIEKELEQITELIGPNFPESLDLEGQGRFALGFYHQKAEFRRRTERKSQEEQNKATSTN